MKCLRWNKLVFMFDIEGVNVSWQGWRSKRIEEQEPLHTCLTKTNDFKEFLHMNKRSRLLFVLVLTAFFALPAMASAATWKVDASHSNVLFRVQHFGAGLFYGSFRKFSGVVKTKKGKKGLRGASISMKINAASVFTNQRKRDKHLRSPDFFNAKVFKYISFKSEKITQAGKKVNIVGKLTFLGKSKAITATGRITGKGKDPWGNTRLGVHVTFTIKRSDFGAVYGLKNGALGDNVKMIVSTELVKKK
tara:strand:+ start:316 stop:1059 length:744 start_codon:yes stop_codon:yes gene_type:complete